MIDLKFDTIAQVIAVSSIDASNHPNLMPKYSVNTGDLVLRIKFSEYVKSQVHLNVVQGLFNRSLQDYAETLWFLEGMMNKQKKAEQVLRYYYADMANFLINNESPVHLILDVDTDNFRLERVDLDVTALADKMLQEFDDAVVKQEIPDNWSYTNVYERARDSQEFRDKSLNFALSSELLRYRSNEKLILVNSH